MSSVTTQTDPVHHWFDPREVVTSIVLDVFLESDPQVIPTTRSAYYYRGIDPRVQIRVTLGPTDQTPSFHEDTRPPREGRESVSEVGDVVWAGGLGWVGEVRSSGSA